MLVRDPITLCMCGFGAFVYGLLYLFLTAYPMVFQGVYGMNLGVGSLPYIGVIVGQLFGAVAIAGTQPWVLRKMERNEGVLMPEWRLPVAIPGAVAFSAGLFWLGWTGNSPSISWPVPAVSTIFIGLSIAIIFMSFNVRHFWRFSLSDHVF